MKDVFWTIFDARSGTIYGPGSRVSWPPPPLYGYGSRVSWPLPPPLYGYGSQGYGGKEGEIHREASKNNRKSIGRHAQEQPPRSGRLSLGSASQAVPSAVLPPCTRAGDMLGVGGCSGYTY